MGVEEDSPDDGTKIAPMEINLQGWVRYMSHWYSTRMQDENDRVIHENSFNMLYYLFDKYIPEYDEAISATSETTGSQGVEEE